MKNNEWEELQTKPAPELVELLEKARAEIGQMHFASPGRQLKHAHTRRNLKKRVARLQMLLARRVKSAV